MSYGEEFRKKFVENDADNIVRQSKEPELSTRDRIKAKRKFRKHARYLNRIRRQAKQRGTPE